MWFNWRVQSNCTLVAGLGDEMTHVLSFDVDLAFTNRVARQEFTIRSASDLGPLT